MLMATLAQPRFQGLSSSFSHKKRDPGKEVGVGKEVGNGIKLTDLAVRLIILGILVHI